MPDLERTVAGLRCRDVLARLSDYLDGDLPPEVVAGVEQHVQGCDWCERFGGLMAAQVAALKRELTEPAPLGAAQARRLRDRLAAEP